MVCLMVMLCKWCCVHGAPSAAPATQNELEVFQVLRLPRKNEAAPIVLRGRRSNWSTSHVVLRCRRSTWSTSGSFCAAGAAFGALTPGLEDGSAGSSVEATSLLASMPGWSRIDDPSSGRSLAPSVMSPKSDSDVMSTICFFPPTPLGFRQVVSRHFTSTMNCHDES